MHVTTMPEEIEAVTQELEGVLQAVSGDDDAHLYDPADTAPKEAVELMIKVQQIAALRQIDRAVRELVNCHLNGDC